MADNPVVYIFHGDDKPAMKATAADLKSKLGDASAAEMNTTIFAGPISFDELTNVVMASPFLANRRLVVVDDATKNFSSPDQKKRFLELAEAAPEYTALVVFETIEGREKEKDNERKKHWLLKWAKSAGARAFEKSFDLPQGGQMATWLRERASALGGELQPAAAAKLAALVRSDKDAAEHELEKLLASVGYQRPVEASDVDRVSLPLGEHGDFFGLIDSLTAGNSKKAMIELEQLIQERDAMLLFFSLVSHFRLLLQSGELVDAGKGDADIARQLGVHPFRAGKLAAQARRFSPSTLEAIYRRLQGLDEQVKTGKIDSWELAMEMFIASFSVQAV